jgi:catechol 2,3-dioxygenase-like lactoylglutathione lyase family enzyme
MPKLQSVKPVLMSRDIEASLAFYRRLGFDEIFRDDPAKPRYAGVRRDGIDLHLQWHAADAWGDTEDRPTYRFVVEEVDELFEEFGARNALNANSVVRDTPWGTRVPRAGPRSQRPAVLPESLTAHSTARKDSPMPVPEFAPGFRLSTLDVVILVVGAVAAVAVSTVDVWIGVAVAFVVAHFFLFCNVLRLSRPPELIWAACFAALAVAATARGAVTWPVAFAASVALTLVLALLELCKPSYHGVGWERVNPRLPTWWRERTGSAHETTGAPAPRDD